MRYLVSFEGDGGGKGGSEGGGGGGGEGGSNEAPAGCEKKGMSFVMWRRRIVGYLKDAIVLVLSHIKL